MTVHPEPLSFSFQDILRLIDTPPPDIKYFASCQTADVTALDLKVLKYILSYIIATEAVSISGQLLTITTYRYSTSNNY